MSRVGSGSAALALALLLVACGGSSGDLAVGTTTSSQPTLASTTTSVASATTTRPAQGATTTALPSGPATTRVSVPPTTTSPSQLQRRETPPGGVAEQLRIGSANFTDGCRVEVPAGPDAPYVIGIGEDYLVCLEGFTAPGPVTVQVLRPDGRSESPRLAAEARGFNRTAQLGDPPGVYKVTARQGTTTAVGSFVVELQRSPTTFDFPPGVGRPGSVFGVGLAGFPAGATVQIDLYRLATTPRPVPGAVYEFQAALSPVRTDGRGEASFRLATRRDDPVGDYCFVPRGIAWVDVHKHLRGRRMRRLHPPQGVAEGHRRIG